MCFLKLMRFILGHRFQTAVQTRYAFTAVDGWSLRGAAGRRKSAIFSLGLKRLSRGVFTSVMGFGRQVKTRHGFWSSAQNSPRTADVR